jgi:hypothetical protein
MWRFCANKIQTTPPLHTAALLNRTRRAGVVLVADGMQLHVIERRKGQLHPNTRRKLKESAGDIIAVLRGEHRERVALMPPDQIGVWDPRWPAPRS